MDGAGPIYSVPKEASAETKELTYDQLQPGDIGVNIGGDGHVQSSKKGKGKAPEMKDESNETTKPEMKDKDTQASPETAELQPVSLEKGEFGYNPGKGDDRDRQEPGEHLAARKQAPTIGSSEGTAETAELLKLSLEKGEFGYNPGKGNEPGEEAGENPGASEARRRLSQSQPHHGIPKNPALQKQAPSTKTSSEASPETKELQQVTMGKDEMGYNIGNEPSTGHSKKKHPDTSTETKELQAIHLHREDIGPQHIKVPPETRELGHIGLGKDEIGYNPGKGDSRDRRPPGEHPAVKKRDYPTEAAPRETEKMTSETSKPDARPEELGNIGIGRDDFGYNVGKGNEPGEEAGENPGASQARRRYSQSQPHHSAKSTQTPETRELGSIHLEKRDIGPQNTQASPETRELRHIELHRGGFGYNVGRGKESGRIRSDEDSTENPSAARARRRASTQSGNGYREERPNFGYQNTSRDRRSSEELGINPQIHEQSCSPRITPSFRDTLPRGEKDTQVNDTLQSYLQSFLSERGSDPTGTTSDCPKIHSSQAMEGASNQRMSSRDREILQCEHRHKTKAAAEKQSQMIPSTSGNGSTAVTFGQLQQVLGQLKQDILESIDSGSGGKQHFSGNISQLGPRLGRIEADIGFIRKQISTPTNNGSANSVLPQGSINGTPNSDISAGFTNASYRRTSQRKMNWGMIGLGVLAALSLVALGGILESTRQAERGWGDKLAEWLFREGRGQKLGR